MGKSENTAFNTVGLIGRRHSAHVADTLSAVVKCLAGHGVRILVEDQTAALLEGEGYGMCSRQALGERCGLIVVVGGDGSLLSVGRDLAHAGVPVVGINRGGLGFLADIAPKRIDEQLGAVLAGEYRVEDHFLLEAKVLRGSRELARSPALNDVVVNPGSLARMMEFSLAVNGEFVYDQRSDGLIVASPTGSTAYALSAGGPIMHPSLDAIVIVPMYPHTLTSRPLVVRGDSTIMVTLGAVERAQVSCDSQVTFDLESGDQIAIEKYASPLRLVYAYGHSFYESCRSKLDWATRLGGQR
ncbi:MAG: NAD(+) kinase [Gammaproteobacteria bacterium]|nr:NAD(+) kinase [Gammaproteobacteria bacterium]MXX29138.1 NAD(+) kinase [Gammaproteobacteria bacterium]